MNEVFGLQLLLNRLEDDEFQTLIDGLVHNRTFMTSVIFKLLLHEYRCNQNASLTHISNVTQSIIHKREQPQDSEDTESPNHELSPVTLNQLPSELISKCTSYLGCKDTVSIIQTTRYLCKSATIINLIKPKWIIKRNVNYGLIPLLKNVKQLSLNDLDFSNYNFEQILFQKHLDELIVYMDGGYSNIFKIKPHKMINALKSINIKKLAFYFTGFFDNDHKMLTSVWCVNTEYLSFNRFSIISSRNPTQSQWSFNGFSSLSKLKKIHFSHCHQFISSSILSNLNINQLETIVTDSINYDASNGSCIIKINRNDTSRYLMAPEQLKTFIQTTRMHIKKLSFEGEQYSHLRSCSYIVELCCSNIDIEYLSLKNFNLGWDSHANIDWSRWRFSCFESLQSIKVIKLERCHSYICESILSNLKCDQLELTCDSKRFISSQMNVSMIQKLECVYVDDGDFLQSIFALNNLKYLKFLSHSDSECSLATIFSRGIISRCEFSFQQLPKAMKKTVTFNNVYNFTLILPQIENIECIQQTIPEISTIMKQNVNKYCLKFCCKLSEFEENDLNSVINTLGKQHKVERKILYIKILDDDDDGKFKHICTEIIISSILFDR
eukprot:245813_1